MILNVGFVPYLNMAPFHVGFGPAPVRQGDVQIQFHSVSPRVLGLEAEAGRIDAGAMSLVDYFRLSDHFEPLGEFGIAVKRTVRSVLLFSKGPIQDLKGLCAITDETSTSFGLLKILVEKRYQGKSVSYGRISSGRLYDGSTEALLLIGDEALRARRDGIKGLPVVTDLAEEWFRWQGCPFVFARWVIRKSIPKESKLMIEKYLENSLERLFLGWSEHARNEASMRGLSATEVEDYWGDFCYRFTPEHHRAMEQFRPFVENQCSTA